MPSRDMRHVLADDSFPARAVRAAWDARRIFRDRVGLGNHGPNGSRRRKDSILGFPACRCPYSRYAGFRRERLYRFGHGSSGASRDSRTLLRQLDLRAHSRPGASDSYSAQIPRRDVTEYVARQMDGRDRDSGRAHEVSSLARSKAAKYTKTTQSRGYRHQLRSDDFARRLPPVACETVVSALGRLGFSRPWRRHQRLCRAASSARAFSLLALGRTFRTRDATLAVAFRCER